jgi:hypothetical protein
MLSAVELTKAYMCGKLDIIRRHQTMFAQHYGVSINNVDFKALRMLF